MKYQTSDLFQFKKKDYNRSLVEPNVKALVESISRCNLLQFRPILVDKHMYVFEGQHRLEACKRLNIPIWYEIKEDLRDEDMILLNNQKAWGYEDYLNFYIKKGVSHYEKLQAYMTKYNIKLHHALSVTGTNTKIAYKAYKEGNYKFPDAFAYEELIKMTELLNEIICYLSEKSMGQLRFLKNKGFTKALCIFMNYKNVDRDLFFQKIQYKMSALHPSTCTKDYLEQLRKIYNYRNQNPINFIDDID